VSPLEGLPRYIEPSVLKESLENGHIVKMESITAEK